MPLVPFPVTAMSGSRTISHSLRQSAAAAALLLGFSVTTLAGSLTSSTLLAPLAPEQTSPLSLTMPRGFAADQDVWVVYELVALSPDNDDAAELSIEQSFERVMTPLTALYVTLRAGDMESNASVGTVAQRLEQLVGHREPEELKRLMGTDLYAAYESASADKEGVLGGRVVTRLPPPGKSAEPLQISVERATGMLPLALRITVGQGELSPEFQQQPKDSVLYRAGYFAALAIFGWLVLRFFRRRN